MKRNMHSSHNLKRHLTRFHNDLFVKIQQQHHNGDSDEVISASIESALQPNQRQKSIQACVEQMKMRITKLAEAVAFARSNLYLHHVCHGLSFRSIEHIHFERFMNALGKYTRVTGSRHEFRRIIPLLEKFVLHKASVIWGWLLGSFNVTQSNFDRFSKKFVWNESLEFRLRLIPGQTRQETHTSQ